MAQALQSGNKLPTPNGLWLDRAQTGEGMMGEVWHDLDDQGEYHFCLSEDVQPGALCTVCVDELQATHVCGESTASSSSTSTGELKLPPAMRCQMCTWFR